MADEPTPQRRTEGKLSPSPRPLAEREPLTVTVVQPAAEEPAAAVETPARRTAIPSYAIWPRVPRWYWVLLAIAAAVVFASYEVQWRHVLKYAAQHRWLPKPVVRVEHSVERHLLGERTSSKH